MDYYCSYLMLVIHKELAYFKALIQPYTAVTDLCYATM